MKKDYKQMNERIAEWAGFIKTPQVAVKTESGTEHADVWVFADSYMSFKMPDFTNFKVLEKFIIPLLHTWAIQSNGDGMAVGKVVDKDGVVYDCVGEKPTVALCMAIEKMVKDK